MSFIKSESIIDLVIALQAAKPKFKPLLKKSENPGFKRAGKPSKYADLATTLDATEDSLLENGLLISQFPVNEGDRVGVLTLLTHKSGQYIGESFTLPLGQSNAQTGVAAVTYARRTSLQAVLGIASEDDDGQTVTGRTPAADDDDTPDFRDASHPEPKANTSRPTQGAPKRGTDKPSESQSTEASSTKSQASTATAPAAPAPSTTSAAQVAATLDEGNSTRGDAYEGPDDDGVLPTEAELNGYRERFKKLGDDLSTPQGKLRSSKGLPIERKLLVFLLRITKCDVAKQITKSKWDDFFARVDKKLAQETGLAGLAKLVNETNGIEDTK